MLKKYFVSNLLLILTLNILIKPAWVFLIDRNVQLAVGHESFGLYNALLSLSLIFGILLDWGLTSYNNRSVASQANLLSESIPNMLVAKFIFSLLYFLVLLLCGLLLGYQTEAIFLLFLAGLIQCANSLLLFLRSTVSGHQHFGADGWLSVMDKLIMILVCGFLLWKHQSGQTFKITWYLYLQITAYLLTIGMAIWLIQRRYTKIQFQRISVSYIKQLVVQSVPYALLILLMGIYMRGDTLMLERLSGPKSNSIYAQAYRILDALNMFGYLLAGVLLPLFTRLLKHKTAIQDIVRTSTNILLSGAIALLTHSVCYREEIMHTLDPQAAPELPMIYLLVICSFPAYCLMYIYSTLLTANAQLRELIGIALIGCLLSFGLNFWLIPRWDAIGAGISALVVQYTVAILSVWRCKIRFQLVSDGKWIIQFLGIGAIMTTFNLFLHLMNIRLLISLLLNIPFFLGLVYLIKLWDFEQLRSLIKQYTPSGTR